MYKNCNLCYNSSGSKIGYFEKYEVIQNEVQKYLRKFEFIRSLLDLKSNPYSNTYLNTLFELLHYSKGRG